MTIATILATAAAESESHAGNVALETLYIGLIAVVAFAALAIVTLSYRNVANRHPRKSEAYAEAHKNDVEHVGH